MEVDKSGASDHDQTLNLLPIVIDYHIFILDNYLSIFLPLLPVSTSSLLTVDTVISY